VHQNYAPAPIPAAAPPPGRTVFGYDVPYDPTSWASLQQHAAHIDYVGAQWVSVDACGNLGSRDDQTLKRFAQARGINVFPSLLTLSGPLNKRLLTDEAIASRLIAQIVAYVRDEGYDGFDLDLEGVLPEERDAYSAFVARLAAALRAHGKPLALAIPPKTRDVTTGWAGAYDYAALGQHADLITIMTYEYHGPWSGPGPIAPYDWVGNVMAFAISQIPPHKVLLGLAFYGYDWNVTAKTARSLRFPQAAELAERYQAPLTLDPVTQSVTFQYRARASDSGPIAANLPPLNHEITERKPPACPEATPSPTPRPTATPTPAPDAIHDHVVWIEDSRSAVARLRWAEQYRTGGIATWRLGQEDPAVWPILQQWRER
jgi:spore germination protein